MPVDVYKRQEKGELNRWIKATNRLMQDVRKKIKALFVWMAEVKEELSKPQTPVSYTHLDVYKRQAFLWAIGRILTCFKFIYL